VHTEFELANLKGKNSVERPRHRKLEQVSCGLFQRTRCYQCSNLGKLRCILGKSVSILLIIVPSSCIDTRVYILVA